MPASSFLVFMCALSFENADAERFDPRGSLLFLFSDVFRVSYCAFIKALGSAALLELIKSDKQAESSLQG